MSDASAREQREVYQEVYKYLRATYDDDLRTQASYVTTVHRLMTIQGLLFASMAFALGQLDWAQTAAAFHLVVLGVAAILGGLGLLGGFACGICAVGIKRWSTVGTKSLEKLIKGDELQKCTPADVLKDLSLNLVGAINENRESMEARHWISRLLNICTMIGFFFVAFFVSYAVIGNAFTH